MQGNESVPTGKGLEKFGDGVLFVTYSLLISGLGGRKAKKEAEDEALAGQLAGAPRLEEGRMQ